MKHQVAGYRLNRDSEHRRALRRNLAIALFTHGQITTTLPKAKSVKGFVEKLITTARQGDLASRRRVIKAIGDPIAVDFDVKFDDAPEGYKVNKYGELLSGPRVVKKLFEEIAPRYADRPGGYTRIVKLARHRVGDGTDLCILQLVSDEDTGPQVAGQFSRRRDKANKRMEFAAQCRKSAKHAAPGIPEAAEVAEVPAAPEAAAQPAADDTAKPAE